MVAMAAHVAILMKRYIDLILAGRKTVESRLTKTPRVPFGVIESNDVIYFKCSAGPYMARAVAGRVVFHDDLTPDKVAALQRSDNAAICGDDAYWQFKRSSHYATLIELKDVAPTNMGPPLAPSNGIAWFVCQAELLPQVCEVTLTEGAVRNYYVRVPAAAPQPKTPQALRPIEMLMPDGNTMRTAILDDHMIRWRQWREYFQRFGVQAGDRVRFERSAPWRYRVSFISTSQRSTTMTPKPNPPTATAPSLEAYVSVECVEQLIRQARAEDLGPPQRDVTTDCLIPADATTRAVIRSRQVGVLAGAALLIPIARCYDPNITVTVALRDGSKLQGESLVAQFDGPLSSILTMERVALNFLTHLSGIASLTREYVLAVAGTAAKIYDTRKTLPGLRGLQKYAVTCGGGHNHRFGLYDAMLVKDNHIAHLPAGDLTTALNGAIAEANCRGPAPKFVQVEVDTLDQLERVLACSLHAVLLDNMDLNQLADAVAMRNKLAPKVQLEASGGVNLETVRQIAQTGIERISVGALTHSAPALDLGLDILT
jgi:nicotinate-nucleotide pyrophosphorylase (carboxylating)